ncbi:fumarylacetoacetate (FAA) hydrolase [Glaciecola sp. 4H-3-7+YE-5]|nr:fumarylacetoacetate (FAA) hydrolase [Glaciecola sp. 4H-3-7+YE-5]
MKLARCESQGQTFWAVVDTEAQTFKRINGAFSSWGAQLTQSINEGNATLAEGNLVYSGDVYSFDSVRLLPPVENVNRVVVAGANYTKHLAADFGLEAPSQPVAFLKAYGALIGANDDIRYPPLTNELDHEVELVVVLGSDDIDLKNTMASVLGYTVGNDVSSRDLQRSGPKGIGMDLFAAKSQDKTTGLGPWIVTKDEFSEINPAFRLLLSVDGEVRQDGNTSDMTWSVAELISFVQQRSSFAAGDVMFTGSPEGVGQGTGRFLNSGELVVATIGGIGSLQNRVGLKQKIEK